MKFCDLKSKEFVLPTNKIEIKPKISHKIFNIFSSCMVRR